MVDDQAEPKRTTMQISMTVEDKRILKTVAAQKGTTVAAMVHEWAQKLSALDGMNQDDRIE